MPEQPASEPAEAAAEATRRLQPSAIPIWFLYDMGRALLGFLSLLIVGGVSPILLLLGLGMLLSPAIRYTRFRYEIVDATLVVQGGVLSRWRRVIPRERVQSVDVVQKLRHRTFGVVALRIEAVGARHTEAAQVALLPQEADRIRRWASGGTQNGQEAAGQPEESPPLAVLGGRDLLLAGVTGGRVAVLAGLAGYGQDLIGEAFFDRATAAVGRLLPGAPFVVIVSVLAAAVLTVALLSSIALTVLVYWNFTLSLEGERLVITRGLLERRRAQIPLRRVQAVQVDQNLIRRLLGLASLSVVVAGYSSEGEENRESSVLLPIASGDKAWQVACRTLGAPDLSSVPIRRPPPRAGIHRGLGPTVLAIAAATSAMPALGSDFRLPYLLVPGVWLSAWLGWRSSGHSGVPGYVLVRWGILVRRTAIVPEPNIQHLQLTWSALQRAWGLASVKLHIPGSLRRASDLDAQDARHWFEQLAERTRGVSLPGLDPSRRTDP